MSFKALREKLNLILYQYKKPVELALKILTTVVSLSATGALIMFFGFKIDPKQEIIIYKIIEFSLAYYVIAFIIKLVYTYKIKEFLRNNLIETTLMVVLAVEGITFNLFGELVISNIFEYFGFDHFSRYTILLTQLFFFVVVVNKALKGSSIIPQLKLNPALLFTVIFILIIFSGTGLLMLPEATVSKDGIHFLDALFLSTSATCVTGLVTFDVAQELSFKGHFIVMFLMKIGGLNILAFGSFMALFSKLGVGVKQHDLIEDFVNKDNLSTSQSLLYKVFIWGTIIEVLGAFGLYIFEGGIVEGSKGDRIFNALFHSISAFNNAGITLFSDGIFDEGLRFNYAYQVILSCIIFFGALGFLSIFDMFSIKKLRERMSKPWLGYEFQTKIALYFSLILVAIGFVLFMVLEYNNTLSEHNWFGKIVVSIFQSVTTRTAGFNSVPFSELSIPILLLFIVLMFIGASSSSTGGGIKTSTFALIWASVVSTIKNHKNVELYKRSIKDELIFRAFSIFLFFIFGITIGIFLLSITEQELLNSGSFSIFDLAFEEVSAFATVGLSTGITSSLSDGGKIVLIFSMFIGRIGTLTVAFLFGREVISRNYKYPYVHTMVG